jgi:hypothetical protein
MMSPPGAAKAFTCSLSFTAKRHGSPGRSERLATHAPTSFT